MNEGVNVVPIMKEQSTTMAAPSCRAARPRHRESVIRAQSTFSLIDTCYAEITRKGRASDRHDPGRPCTWADVARGIDARWPERPQRSYLSRTRDPIRLGVPRPVATPVYGQPATSLSRHTRSRDGQHRHQLADQPVDYFGRTFSRAKYAAARLRTSFSISNCRLRRRSSASSVSPRCSTRPQRRRRRPSPAGSSSAGRTG